MVSIVRPLPLACGEGLGGSFAEEGAVIGGESAEVPEAPVEGDALDGAGCRGCRQKGPAGSVEPLVPQVGIGADAEEIAAEDFEAASAQSDCGAKVVDVEWLSEMSMDEIAGGAQFPEAAEQSDILQGNAGEAPAAEGESEGVDDFGLGDGENACGVGIASLCCCDRAQTGDDIINPAERGTIRHEGSTAGEHGGGGFWKMGLESCHEGGCGDREGDGAESGGSDRLDFVTGQEPAEHAWAVRHSEIE